MTLNTRLGRGIRRLVGDYRLNWVYASPRGSEPIRLLPGLVVRPSLAADLDHAASSDDAQARKAADYARGGATGFVLAEQEGAPLGIVHFADRAHYAHDSVWPLRADQLALLDIVMVPAARGQGHAAGLIATATPLALALATSGQVGAICFIWWNHRASLRAFRRAGWRALGFSAEVTTRDGHARRLRVRWPSRATVP